MTGIPCGGRRWLSHLLLISLIFIFTPASKAEFSLNFERAPADVFKELDISCHRAESSFDCDRMAGNDGFRDPDPTPFLMERVIKDGKEYYHNIIGDPNSGFAIEYFIGVARCCWPNGLPYSASGGSYNGGVDAAPYSIMWNQEFYDPLDANPWLGGNGTGTPQEVIFRQVLESGGLSQETVKATFANKPRISQDIAAHEINSHFIADMSMLTYDNSATNLNNSGEMVNTLTIYDKTPDQVIAEFDMARDSQHSDVTAGKFGYRAPDFYDPLGGYEYKDGDYDVLTVDWTKYRDPDPEVNTPDI